MKILLVTADFAARDANPWLLDDLAAALARAGHTVDVLVHNPKVARPRGINPEPAPGISVYSVGTIAGTATRGSKLRSYIATGVRLHTVGWRFARRSTYDLCIYTSIGAFSFGFPARIRRQGIAKALLFIMWDFFPIHQIDIGRIRSSWLHRPLKWLEWLAIRDSDIIATMSPANERFLRTYHPRVHSQLIRVPPWASTRLECVIKPERRASFTAVFGGQLVKGRGVDTILRAAKLLQDDGHSANIIIAGDGSERTALTALARELDLRNVEFVGALPRSEYRDLLQTAHAGIAATVPGVTPPSFPSKIVEYCANGLPVVVCVEVSSDAGKYVEEHGAGLAVRAGDHVGLARALAALSSEYDAGTLGRWASAAQSLFDNELSVDRAVERIAQAVYNFRHRVS